MQVAPFLNTLSGHWTGTYDSEQFPLSEPADLVISQNGAAVSGTLSYTFNGVGYSSTFTGTANQNDVGTNTVFTVLAPEFATKLCQTYPCTTVMHLFQQGSAMTGVSAPFYGGDPVDIRDWRFTRVQ